MKSDRLPRQARDKDHCPRTAAVSQGYCDNASFHGYLATDPVRNATLRDGFDCGCSLVMMILPRQARTGLQLKEIDFMMEHFAG
jgi:hypothetical protein